MKQTWYSPAWLRRNYDWPKHTEELVVHRYEMTPGYYLDEIKKVSRYGR